MITYRARLIDRGHIIAEQLFQAENDTEAWSEAHEGRDPFDPQWIEVTRTDMSGRE